MVLPLIIFVVRDVWFFCHGSIRHMKRLLNILFAVTCAHSAVYLDGGDVYNYPSKCYTITKGAEISYLYSCVNGVRVRAHQMKVTVIPGSGAGPYRLNNKRYTLTSCGTYTGQSFNSITDIVDSWGACAGDILILDTLDSPSCLDPTRVPSAICKGGSGDEYAGSQFFSRKLYS